MQYKTYYLITKQKLFIHVDLIAHLGYGSDFLYLYTVFYYLRYI